MNRDLASLKNKHLSFVEFVQLNNEKESHVLGAICYSSTPLTDLSESIIDAPLICVSMPPIAEMQSDAVCDVWLSGSALKSGHCTMHPGDVQEQTRETLTNIEAVIQAANLQAHKPLFSLSSLFYRVYVRHSADLAAIRDIMLMRIGASFNAIFLQADVCRQDLLVEMEASASLPA